MKLDRNINPDGRGKYALLNLRKTDLSLDEIRRRITEVLGGQVLQFGDNPETEFFVIKLKDKYGVAGLKAYADAARVDDPEYASEIDAMVAKRLVVRRWRVVNDPEEIHQYFEAGANIIPSILGACGKSVKPEHVDEFWWSASSWHVEDNTNRGYEKTLEAAKSAVEAWLLKKGDMLIYTTRKPD